MTTTSTALAKQDQAAAPAKTEKSNKRSSEALVDFVIQCWEEAETATDTRRAQWRELWNAYESKQDTRHKAKWQSQLFVPKVWMHTTKAAAEIKRAMLQTQKLFKLELDDSAERADISLYRRIRARAIDARQQMALDERIRNVEKDLTDQRAQMSLDEARFKSDLTRTNLAAVYSEMTIVAPTRGRFLIYH